MLDSDFPVSTVPVAEDAEANACEPLLMKKPLGSDVCFVAVTHPILTSNASFRTGLYAESHGIVANVSRHCTYPLKMHLLTLASFAQNFWDPHFKSDFHYHDETSTWNSSWWFGEPVSSSLMLHISNG